MFRLFTIIAALGLMACQNMAGEGTRLHEPGLTLQKLATDSATPGTLFSHYQTSGVARWNRDWPWKLDLTGVAWDVPTTVTAITPRHVVMADHFQRAVGHSAVFHDRKGKAHSRKIIRIIRLRDLGVNCDAAVGLLDLALPKSIRTYPLPDVSDPNELVGATTLVTDHSRNLSFHRIAGIVGTMIRFRHDPGFPKSRSRKLIVGDSGNPSFLLCRGELLLLETHTTGGAGAGPFYGANGIVAAIRKAIASTDPTMSLRLVKPDAPTLSDAKQHREPPVQPAPSPVKPNANPPSATTPPPSEPRRPRRRVIVPE